LGTLHAAWVGGANYDGKQGLKGYELSLQAGSCTTDRECLSCRTAALMRERVRVVL